MCRRKNVDELVGKENKKLFNVKFNQWREKLLWNMQNEILF